MEHKQLFNVLITDEDGKELVNCKSDCIVGAITDVEEETEDTAAIGTVYFTSCLGIKIVEAFKCLQRLKEQEIAEDKVLKKLFTLDAFQQLQDIIDREIKEGKGDA